MAGKGGNSRKFGGIMTGKGGNIKNEVFTSQKR